MTHILWCLMTASDSRHPDDGFSTGAGVPSLMSLLDLEYKGEGTRKESLEKRAQFVITSAGAFVSLLLALAGLAIGGPAHDLPVFALVLLLLAIGCFVAAAILSLMANDVAGYEHVNITELEATLATEWESLGLGRAEILVAKATIAALRSARERNDAKSRRLSMAIRLEVIAIVVLAGAVAVLVIDTSLHSTR